MFSDRFRNCNDFDPLPLLWLSSESIDLAEAYSGFVILAVKFRPTDEEEMHSSSDQIWFSEISVLSLE